jgi:uncharacterized protein (DUF952 family)
VLYHITTRVAWDAACTAGRYTTEGPFIHLSLDRQWPGVRDRFYRDTPDLVLLTVDERAVTAEIRYERADGDDFPHLYGALELAAVVAVTAL